MDRQLSSRTALAAAALVALTACQDAEPTAPSFDPRDSPGTSMAHPGDAGDAVAALEALMGTANAALAEADAPYRVGLAEFITHGDGDFAGQTVLAKDVGNKRLPYQRVPFDPRRAAWSGPVDGATDDLTWAFDQSPDGDPLGPTTAAQADAALGASMATWDALDCSDPGLRLNPTGGIDLGRLAWLSGLGGWPIPMADIQHAGFGLSLGPGILAAAFTFFFVNPATGELTDIDADGNIDSAFTEIYYSAAWLWGDGNGSIDIESVAAHEAGHGFGQAHFGQVAVVNGMLTVSPRAVMNALYTGPFRELQGSDVGGHCSMWSQWPTH